MASGVTKTDKIVIHDVKGLDRGWHGAGIPIVDKVSDAVKVAEVTGLNRRVLQTVLAGVAVGSPACSKVLNYYAATEDRPAVELGVVGKDYTVAQNLENIGMAFDLANMGKSDEEIRAYLDTGGSLFGGLLSFVSLAGGEFSIARNDKDIVKPLFGMWWGHDGTTALTGAAFTTRIVCNNTRRAALREAKQSGALWKLKHTKDMEDRKVSVMEAMAQWKSGVKEFREQAEILASQQISGDKLKEFVGEIFTRIRGGVPASDASGRAATTQRNYAEGFLGKVKDYLDLEFQRTGTMTKWNVANAITEHLQKSDMGKRPRTDDEVADRRWLSDLNGDMADDKVKVFRAALELV